MLLLQFLAIGLFAQQLNIPVVVHIVYPTGAPAYDISDADVAKMIGVVNSNFAGLSSNNNISREIFDSLIANTEIQFCLAAKDANGNATSGITHSQTSVTLLQGDVAFAEHFSPIWDTMKYCNIWIYSGVPTDTGSTGVNSSPTVNYNNASLGSSVYRGVGVIRGSNWKMFQNVLTHELGHFTGLYHTFEADSVGDTPCSTYGTYDDGPCSSANLALNTCSAEDPFWGTINPPDMLENFMNYQLDCQKMFTKGQKARMRNKVTTLLTSLLANTDTHCKVVTTGVAAAGDLLQVAIYPNPAQDAFRLKGLTGTCSVTLINSLGQKVLSVPSVTDKQSVSVASLAPGIYYVRIMANDRVSTLRLIKS